MRAPGNQTPALQSLCDRGDHLEDDRRNMERQVQRAHAPTATIRCDRELEPIAMDIAAALSELAERQSQRLVDEIALEINRLSRVTEGYGPQ